MKATTERWETKYEGEMKYVVKRKKVGAEECEERKPDWLTDRPSN
jgi:hypothetical protein